MAGSFSMRYGTSRGTESLMLETAGTGISVTDFPAADFQTGLNDAMQRNDEPRTGAAGARVNQWMHVAQTPARAADHLARALGGGRSATVRSGRTFQARIEPLLARFVARSWQRGMIFSSYRGH